MTLTTPRWVLARNKLDWRLPLLDLVVLLICEIVFGAEDRGVPIRVAMCAAIVTAVVFGAVGMYRTRLTLSALDQLPRLIGWSLVVCVFVFWLFAPGLTLGDSVLVGLANAGLLFLVRVFYYASVRDLRRRNAAWRMRTLIIGGGVVGREIVDIARSRPELGIDPVVALSQDPLPAFEETGLPIYSDIENIQRIVTDQGIDAVIVAFSRTPDSEFVAPLRECDSLDCEVYIVPRLYEFTPLSSDMDRIHTIPLIRVRRDALRTWHWKAKRTFDIVVVSVGLVLASPLMAGTALAVYLSDPKAPIIFRQQRIGKDGRLFDLMKFRSMRPVPAELSNVDWHPTDSDRIGPVGRVIRKTSLDELPQLWNVFRGDMSLVGPRPERPHFVNEFQTTVRSYRDRHRVNVGLTGWAAINGLRGDTSIEDRALYDNFYIENWSIWLDIKVMLLTVGAVLRGTGS